MNKKLVAAVIDAQSKHAHLSFEKKDGLLTLYVDPKQLTAHDLYQTLLGKLRQVKQVEIDYKTFATATQLTTEVLAGVLAAAVEFANHEHAYCLKTVQPNPKKHQVSYDASLQEAFNAAVTVAQAQTQARRLQEMPSNHLHPTAFVNEIHKLFEPFKDQVKVTVLNNKDLLAKKMGLICGVAQGSDHGAYIVSLEYNTNPQVSKLGLVGKGVCFDTGGYSLKTGGHMRNMKFDMSGAAAVVTAVYALAKNQVKTNVVGVVGLVENLISLKSYRVDDILTSYQGDTVEIDNTDAEGRLVLADCLTYAHKDLKVDYLLSIATLTGAIISALGETYAGGWSKYDGDWQALNLAAQNAGEGLWRMPFHNDYFKLLKSTIADFKNSVSSPLAGSSRAACFLKEFTSDKPYYHIDIAGMDSFTGGVGTGPFVRTLYLLAKNHK